MLSVARVQIPPSPPRRKSLEPQWFKAFFLKRYKIQRETILLLPENPDYDPIIVSAKDSLAGYASIIGVALEVRHTL